MEGLCSNVAIKERLGLQSVEDVVNLPDDHEVWDMVGHYLGTMCANLTLSTSVKKIVIGGGVMNRSILYKKIRTVFSKQINGYLQHERLREENLDEYIVRSRFQNELGMISAAAVGASADVWVD